MDVAEARARIAEFPDAVVGGTGADIVVDVALARWVAFAAFAKETLACSYFSFLSAMN